MTCRSFEREKWETNHLHIESKWDLNSMVCMYVCIVEYGKYVILFYSFLIREARLYVRTIVSCSFAASWPGAQCS